MKFWSVLKEFWTKIKEKIGWVISGIIAIIVLTGSKKRDSKQKLESSDAKIRLDQIKITKEEQQRIFLNYYETIKKNENVHNENVLQNVKEAEQRAKELENNPKELDKVLKEKYDLKEG